MRFCPSYQNVLIFFFIDMESGTYAKDFPRKQVVVWDNRSKILKACWETGWHIKIIAAVMDCFLISCAIKHCVLVRNCSSYRHQTLWEHMFYVFINSSRVPES